MKIDEVLISSFRLTDLDYFFPSGCLFISCTKERKEKTPLYKTLLKLARIEKFYFYFFENNKDGLSTCYNKILNLLYENFNNYVPHTIKYIIFIHDDVEILDLLFFDKIRKYLEKYDILGQAGSKLLDINKSPLQWGSCHYMFHRGFVEHERDEGKYTMNTFGPKGEVVCMDGLFIACNLESLYNKKLLFDEQFTFDFYDMDFSVRAFKSGLKLYIGDIHLKHYSIGEGILKESYKIAENKFKEKMKKGYL